MLFNSLTFLCFFPIVCIGYFVIPHKARWVWLLAASYVFYMGWNAVYALLLFAVTLTTWLVGIGISRCSSKKKKKIILAAGILFNLSVLFVFKYLGFFTDTLCALLSLVSITYAPTKYSLVLPVGISFFTFQAIGYAIDVYRGEIPAQAHFGKYALFVSFFPQLVAGPIERSKNLLPQFEEIHHFDTDRAASGMRLMAWGYFKKIVIADTLCTAVNRVYGNLQMFQGLPLIIVSVLFSIQIFCDFSGYSDIARGCARIMGFRLMKNFDHPYFSRSIKEFWKRWHISLSTWFRDYVYIPLGGNRKGKARKDLNLVITFLVSGLWHGADWTYVLWGGLHAVFQIIGNKTESFRAKIAGITKLDRYPKVYSFFQMAITFCLVCIAWVFFRADSLRDAVYVLTNMFHFEPLSFRSIYAMLKLVFDTRAEVYRLLLTLPVFLAASFIDWKWSLEGLLARRNCVVRFVLYILTVVYILLAARADVQDFIYFQF